VPIVAATAVSLLWRSAGGIICLFDYSPGDAPQLVDWWYLAASILLADVAVAGTITCAA
jgi:hypothetical protein